MQYQLAFYNLYLFQMFKDKLGGQGLTSYTQIKAGRLGFITRALTKNNVVAQTPYLAMLAIQKLTMIYYVFRLADPDTINSMFSAIDDFMNVDYLGEKVPEGGNKNSTLELVGKGRLHAYINFAISAIYFFFLILFLTMTFKMASFQKITKTSAILRCLSFFLVISLTVLQVPVIASIFITYKVISIGVLGSLTVVSLIVNTILVLTFIATTLYTYKFFKLEVPNDDVPWSQNSTSGMYVKLVFRIVLCSQDIYRPQLKNKIIQIILSVILLGFASLNIFASLNTAGIFNIAVHSFSFIFETVVLSCTVVALISAITDRNVMTTLLFLILVFPVVYKILLIIKNRKTHQVLTKLKFEEPMTDKEYLMVFSHLHRIIQRQGEDDIAQLYSLTYQHKINCYDTSCICQFFTYYCQDPTLTQTRRKLQYKNYVDDNLLIKQRDHKDDEVFENISSRGQSNQRLNESNDTSHLGQFNSDIDQSARNLQDLTPSIVQEDLDMKDPFGKPQEVGEHEDGIFSLFFKSALMRSHSQNNYDQNMDFKVKCQFKSPSQFKSIKESRLYFFVALLGGIFQNLKSTTKKNFSFQLIVVYFMFQFQHHQYLPLMSLLKLAKQQRRGIIDSITFQSCEYYLLELVLAEFNQNQNETINIEKYIQGSKMQQKLDCLFEETTSQIIQFWTSFKEELANVQKVYALGLNVASNLSSIKLYVKKLEESHMIKDYNKYHQYAMFYLCLANDKQTHAQMINNLRNLISLKNIRKQNSQLGSFEDINEVGFAVLSLDSTSEIVGNFIFANKTFCQFMEIQEEEITNHNGAMIMPDLVRMHHHLFLQRFYETGLPKILGKSRSLFVKDFNNYVKPVQFFLNFHYDATFNYCAIVQVEPVMEQKLVNCEGSIPTSDVMYFLCKGSYQIANISKSCVKHIGLSKSRIKEETERVGRDLMMGDLIIDFMNVEEMISQNRSKFLDNKLVGIKDFTDCHKEQVLYCSLTYSEHVYLEGESQSFTEKIFALIPQSKLPEIYLTSCIDINIRDDLNRQLLNSRGQSVELSHGQSLGKNPQNTLLDLNNPYSADDSDDDKLRLSADGSSLSSSSIASSSSNYASTKAKLFSQQSPKVLTLYSYIIAAVFTVFIAITSVNLAVFIREGSHVNDLFNLNYIIDQRGSSKTFSIMNMEVLHHISTNRNIYDQSNIFEGSRYDYYSAQFKDDVNQYQKQHQEFTLEGKKQDLLQTQIERNQVLLSFLSTAGTTYTKQKPMSYGHSLLGAYLQTVDLEKLLELNLTQNLQTYIDERVEQNLAIPDLVKDLYFIYNVGITALFSVDQQQEVLIEEEVIRTSVNSQTQILVTIYISIAVITAIGVFTLPFMAKIQDRRISVLKLFNILTVEKINELINSAKDYQHDCLVSNKKRLQRSVNELACNKQVVEGSESDILDGRNKPVEGLDKNCLLSEELKEDTHQSSNQKELSIMQSKKSKKQLKGRSQKMNKIFQEEEPRNQPAFQRSRKQKAKQGVKPGEGDVIFANVNQIRQRQDDPTEKSQSLRGKQSSRQKMYEEDSNDPCDQQDEGTVYFNQESNANKGNSRGTHILNQINKTALTEKTKFAFYVFLVVCFLNSNLIASLFIGRDTFQQEQSAVDGIDTFYSKEQLAGHLIVITRDMYIHNHTIQLDQTDDAATEFLQEWEKVLKEYNEMRKNLPPYLTEAQSLIDKFESSELCSTLYEDNQEQATKCEEVYDSVMERGLNSALYQIYNYFQQLIIAFNSQQRTKEFLESKIADPQMRDMIDLLNFIIRDAFVKMNEAVSASALAYFDKQKQSYAIVYSIYLVLAIVLALVFGFFFHKKLKLQIINSTNILAIMPIEDLNMKDRAKVEAFVSS